MTAHKLQVKEMYSSKQHTVVAIAKTLSISRVSATATRPAGG